MMSRGSGTNEEANANGASGEGDDMVKEERTKVSKAAPRLSVAF
jgi:hypothetical protein